MERQISLRLIVIFCVLAFTLLFSAIAVSFDSKNSESYSSFVSTSNIDIDGNNQFDALTDGLLILRSMFELSGDPLITGVVANDAVYTDADDIEGRIASLGNKLDIDDDGNVDALTDGLLVLRYLFELREGALTVGVVSPDAKRTEASDIEAYLDQLTTLFIPTPETEPPVISDLSLSSTSIDFSNLSIGEQVSLTVSARITDESGIVDNNNDRVLLYPLTTSGGAKNWQILNPIESYRTSGDTQNGVYEFVINLTLGDHPAGDYEISVHEIRDPWGNISAGGPKANLTIINSREETEPPVISDLSLSSTSIDFSNLSIGEQVSLTVSARITDESGIVDNNNDRVLLYPLTTSGGAKNWQILNPIESYRTSGDTQNGVYEFVINLTLGDHPAGDYEISVHEIRDPWGNISAGGPKANLTIINSRGESVPPVISDFDIISQNVVQNILTFNSATETQAITLQWRLQDDSGVSGLPTSEEYPRVLLQRSDGGSGGSKNWRINDYDAIRASGDAFDGVYEMTVDLNAEDHPVGTYSLTLKEIQDILGNIGSMNNEDSYQISIQK